MGSLREKEVDDWYEAGVQNRKNNVCPSDSKLA